MLISKKILKKLSSDIRLIIDGNEIDIRDNHEGIVSTLKNDIHTLANLKNEQVIALQHDRDSLKDSLADISHQLKTPLTSMILMADLLEDAPPEKRTEFITNIRMGLARMEWLVATLLKMAKLDAGAVEFSPEHIHSGVLITSALEPLHILLEIKNQQVETIGGGEFICDRRWTVEALTNILKNALEYSPEGSIIRAEVGKNPICSWISITDSGNGISNSEVDKLFKRFEGSNNGYGIGLPLALSIMRVQNGDIEINGGKNNTPPSGATVTLKFY